MSRVASILRFVPVAETRTDGELLAAFHLYRDEAAFAELVRRHGPLVWGVCRRLLPDHADAEDAFQAAFLVLVRRAKSLTDRSTLGPWLYKVAAWTARNLRRKNARRLARQTPLAAPVPAPPTAPDCRLDIDAALLALPEKYRAPLILCHLEGLSRRDAAERLGCPEGTLSSLLSRGLAKLRARLAGHEFVLATVPALLASSTVRAACATRLAVGASVNHLIEGVLHMFWVKKATGAMTALVVVFGFGIGVGVTNRTGTVAVAADEKPATPQTPGPIPSTRLLDLAQIELFTCENTLNALFDGHAVLKQKLDAAKPDDPKWADLWKQEKQLASAFERYRLKVHQARARVAELNGQHQPNGEIESLKDQLKVLARQRDEAAKGVKYTEERMVLTKQGVDKGAVSRAEYLQDLVTLTRFQEELAVRQQSYDALAALTRERETPPTGPTLVVTAVPESAAGQWVITEYGPGGKLVGSMTAEHDAMLTLFLTRSAKDSAAPKDVRVVVRDGAALYAAFAAVAAAKEAGFKSVKFTGTIPPKAGIPAGSKDLPRHHLDDFETEKLYNKLLTNLLKC